MRAPKNAQDPVKVMFVCMGNICRSPSAEALFRYHVETSDFRDLVQVASSGTHSYHVGHPADARSHQTALARGIDMSTHRAQHFKKEHFEQFDYILVMDHANYDHVMRMCPHGMQEKVHYFLDYAPQLKVKEVPDPYYCGPDGFEHVLDLIEAASAGLLSDIRTRWVDPPPVGGEINA